MADLPELPPLPDEPIPEWEDCYRESYDFIRWHFNALPPEGRAAFAAKVRDLGLQLVAIGTPPSGTPVAWRPGASDGIAVNVVVVHNDDPKYQARTVTMHDQRVAAMRGWAEQDRIKREEEEARLSAALSKRPEAMPRPPRK